MKTIIQFSLSKGKKYYVAQSVELPIVTQAKTLDKLIKNIKEALHLFLKDADLQEIGIAKKPSIMVNFEIPQLVTYA